MSGVYSCNPIVGDIVYYWLANGQSREAEVIDTRPLYLEDRNFAIKLRIYMLEEDVVPYLSDDASGNARYLDLPWMIEGETKNKRPGFWSWCL